MILLACHEQYCLMSRRYADEFGLEYILVSVCHKSISPCGLDALSRPHPSLSRGGGEGDSWLQTIEQATDLNAGDLNAGLIVLSCGRG